MQNMGSLMTRLISHERRVVKYIEQVVEVPAGKEFRPVKPEVAQEGADEVQVSMANSTPVSVTTDGVRRSVVIVVTWKVVRLYGVKEIY